MIQRAEEVEREKGACCPPRDAEKPSFYGGREWGWGQRISLTERISIDRLTEQLIRNLARGRRPGEVKGKVRLGGAHVGTANNSMEKKSEEMAEHQDEEQRCSGCD